MVSVEDTLAQLHRNRDRLRWILHWQADACGVWAANRGVDIQCAATLRNQCAYPPERRCTMMRSIIVLALLAAGCAGGHPVYVKCKGKGTVTGTTSILIYSGNFVLTADCEGNDGFEYEGRRFRPKEDDTVKKAL